MPRETLDVVLVHPDLLGLYGDRGNAVAITHLARRHDLDVRLIEVPGGDPVPRSGDLYLVGGGEDRSMLLSYKLLVEDGGLRSALESGRPAFAVCAGLQILSEEFAGPDGTVRAGLGVLDARCPRLTGARAVGDVVTDGVGPVAAPLLGYENHQGGAELGPQAAPLGRVRAGVGNGPSGDEGIVQGAIVATYLHGPALVLNPALATHLLGLAIGRDLPVLEDPAVTRLRSERIRLGRPVARSRR